MNKSTSDAESVGIIKTVKNKKVIELLKKQGKTVVEFPEIKTEKIKIGEREQQLIENLEDFDWLVFSDIFAVDYFFEDLTETDFDLFRLDEFKIYANGEAVADKLRFSQIHADVIPQDISPQTILTAISDYIFDNSNLKISKFLVIKAENKKDELSKVFTDNDLAFELIDVYKINSENRFEAAKFKTLLLDTEINRFILTAPEDFESLKQISGEFDFENNQIEFDTTDEITSQTLAENRNKKRG